MRNVACKNGNSAMSPDPYFTSFSFLERDSATVRNILMVLGRNVECRMQE